MKFSKKVLDQYKKSISSTAPVTMIFGLIIILVLILGYIFPPTYILTIPLIVLPSLFGYQISLVAVKYVKKHEVKAFFNGFKIYYSSRGFGAYSALRGLLKSFIAFIIALTISLSISLSISMGMDSSLKDIITKLISSSSIQEYSSYLNSLIKNESFIFCSNLSFVIAFFPCLYMFFHNTFVYSIKTYMSMNAGTQDISMRGISFIYRTSFSYIRKNVYKNYYSLIWINIVLFTIGYALGSTIGMIFLQSAYAFRIATIGLATAFILNLLLLPLVFEIMETIFLNNKKNILSASLFNVIKEYEKYLKNPNLPDKERKEIEKVRDEYKKTVDEMIKESDEEEQKNSE